jgi:hypothetical protein
MKRLTGSTSYFIEAPNTHSEVVDWFRRLPEPPEETPTAYGITLYFRSFGPLARDETGAIDVAHSPVVTIGLPVLRRDILWTIGEVHFLATLSLPQNSSLRGVSRAFSRWLKGNEAVYVQTGRSEQPYAYYLEGSAKNWGDVYALPSGLEHLKRGGYVVSLKDNDFVVDRVCRSLRLRGVNCGDMAN